MVLHGNCSMVMSEIDSSGYTTRVRSTACDSRVCRAHDAAKAHDAAHDASKAEAMAATQKYEDFGKT